jgi:hypothetical protein
MRAQGQGKSLRHAPCSDDADPVMGHGRFSIG